MGFEVRIVVVCPKSPNEHVLKELDHRFGEVVHEHGSKTVTISEHVSMPDEEDAIEFVRSLVLDAAPEGSKIAEISATPG
jgi:hypothetical protein